MPVRVRFAPSPTGLLHIGGLRTALYNWLFARRHAGAFILRIEDTDRSRLVEGAEEDILEGLRWAGLDIDEGPGLGGSLGPYRQSERAEIYREHAERLLEAGHAYLAFDTQEELEAMRERQRKAGEAAPTYDASVRAEMANSLTLAPEEVRRRLEAGEPHVVRLKVPEGRSLRFEDLIRGWVTFETAQVDDQVLIKSDGMPTYHLANVVDDHLMGITHVIRGEEWLPSVPKHLLLYKAFGWEPPAMAHLPLILSPTGGKLSKRSAERHGIEVAVRHYREAGYEPEALVNFLALLGWNPGTEQELFSLEELVEAYSIERTGQSGAQLDLERLRWFNGLYIRQKSAREIAREARPALERHGLEADDETLLAAAALLQPRITFVEEIATEGRYFFEDPETYDEAGVKRRWREDSAGLLTDYAKRLEDLETFDEATTEAALRELAEERGVGAGRIIHPTRLAVTGTMAGAGLFETMVAVGRAACVRRLRRAAEVLG